MKIKKIKFIFSFVLVFLFGIGISQSFALQTVPFGPEVAAIYGAIPYSLLGKYRAEFGAFKGRITLDEDSEKIHSVYLEIEVNSIHSNSAWCDKMVRSRRLLNTARYPRIVFKSDKIILDEGGYKVKGILEMHGVKRKMIFPFKLETSINRYTKRRMLVIKGNWNIDRKDFNIVWSKTLDHGGILVGDIFTVNWGVKLYIPSKEQ